jgi:hypothetical protein
LHEVAGKQQIFVDQADLEVAVVHLLDAQVQRSWMSSYLITVRTPIRPCLCQF